jgi:hypothetical protein
MGREYLVGDQLVGKDVGSSAAPQVRMAWGSTPGLNRLQGLRFASMIVYKGCGLPA